MTFKDFMYKGVLMIAVLALIGWLGKYLYLVDGEIDWFRLMLVYGVPVGIPPMFFMVPWHWDFPPPYKGKQNCSSALTMKKQPN